MKRWQAIIWTNTDLIQWRIYAPLGGDELMMLYQSLVNLFLVTISDVMVSFLEYVPNQGFLKWRKISFIRCFCIRLHIKSVRHQGHFHSFNTLRPRKMDGISQTTFSDAFSRMKKMWISLKIPLKFVPKGPINNIPSLSHPSLGWLYVFSSFPLPPPPPPPPPQWLLLLTSKPFELDLRYLGQRKYRSGKMYWMTFGWPWPKVTAVTLINKNLLVCRIKWERFNQSLQNLAAISLWSWSSPD